MTRARIFYIVIPFAENVVQKASTKLYLASASFMKIGSEGRTFFMRVN